MNFFVSLSTPCFLHDDWTHQPLPVSDLSFPKGVGIDGSIMLSAGRCCFFHPKKNKHENVEQGGEFFRARSGQAGGEQQERHTGATNSSHSEFEYPAGRLGMCALLPLTMLS